MQETRTVRCKTTTRWYLRRQYHNEFGIIYLGEHTDISRSTRSIIPLDRASFQHVSKQHCIISCKDEVATLTDETSSTGTFVNWRKFSRDNPGSIVLSSGDRIGIGTPCFQDGEFYRKNKSVLLYQVCMDRDVEIILVSGDEPDEVTGRQIFH